MQWQSSFRMFAYGNDFDRATAAHVLHMAHHIIITHHDTSRLTSKCHSQNVCKTCEVPNVFSRVLPETPLGSVTAIAQRNGITTGKSTDRHLCKGHLQTTNASQWQRTHGTEETGKEEIGMVLLFFRDLSVTLIDIVS